MTTKYIIRENTFAYEEFYLTCCIESSEIQSIFDSEATAENELKKLTANYLRNADINEYDVGNGYLSSEQWANIAKFTEENFGVADDNLNEFNFNEWTDEQVFEFAKIIGWLPYKMETIKGDLEYFTYWLNYPEKYFEIYKGVIHESDFEDLRNDDDLEYFLKELKKTPIFGSLEEIATDKDTLEKIIDNEYLRNRLSFDYDKEKMVLQIVQPTPYQDYEILKDINNLLKKPWFEVRPKFRKL